MKPQRITKVNSNYTLCLIKWTIIWENLYHSKCRTLKNNFFCHSRQQQLCFNVTERSGHIMIAKLHLKLTNSWLMYSVQKEGITWLLALISMYVGLSGTSTQQACQFRGHPTISRYMQLENTVADMYLLPFFSSDIQQHMLCHT